MSAKKATLWFLFWVVLAMIFNAGIYFVSGPQKALEFLGGYIIEKSLSIDNLFLFLMIFTAFKIPAQYQPRVLTYGIIGAIIFRAIFIFLGVNLVNSFHWLLYIFGAILIYSGIKMFTAKEDDHDPKDSKLIKILQRFIPTTAELDGQKFFTRINGVLHATPLFVVIFLIELTDILFAIDSIPAVFSITTDPFIVYTSNLFAIMGLRSLYFLLERLKDNFRFVKHGVAMLLTFAGFKLLGLMFGIKLSVLLSVSIIFFILAASMILSVLFKEPKPEQGTEQIS